MKISKSFKIYINIILALFFLNYLNASTNTPKNLIVHEKPKLIQNINFKDINLQNVDLSKNKGKIVILNFWATWCAPCKKEMPSLDQLSLNNNVKIFPINMEKPNIKKTSKFFEDLGIRNLKIYFDPEFELAKKFKLRGLPTSIIINKEGKEFGKIVGEINFQDENFLNLIDQLINS
tara:strand:+ start:13 stop:543 length:531 start_codon:yes stop_codon:yes gene_type:complete